MLAFLLVFFLSVSIQSEVQPDRWRTLIINEATPDSAIKKLGAPTKDSTDRLRVFDVESKWITEKQKEKVYRRLEFKVEGMKRAVLTFADDKLVMIELEPEKEIQASALRGIYGVEFAPRFSGWAVAASPRDYERHEGKLYPKNYPSVYSAVAVTDQVFVGALVNNASFGAAMRGSLGVPDTSTMPGKVARIQIVSRKLENKDGAEALK